MFPDHGLLISILFCIHKISTRYLLYCPHLNDSICFLCHNKIKMAQTKKKKKLTDAKMALLRERKSNGFAYLAGKQRHNFTNYLMIYSKMAFSKTYFTKNDETHTKNTTTNVENVPLWNDGAHSRTVTVKQLLTTTDTRGASQSHTYRLKKEKKKSLAPIFL